MIKVSKDIYSYLSAGELKELRRCLKIAYPNNKPKQQRDYVTLACQPEAAKRFVQHPAFKPNC